MDAVLADDRCEVVELGARGRDAQLDRGCGRDGLEEGFEALLGAEAACEEHPQVARGAPGGPGRWAGQKVVGDAPGDLLDLAPVCLGGELEQTVGHGAGGDDDRVGGGGGLAQDAQLCAVVLGVQEVGAVDEGEPRVSG